MNRRFLSACFEATMAALIVATAASPASAIQERVRECPCNPGYVHRKADANDFVCVRARTLRLIARENQSAPQNRISDTDIGCKPGFVWRDAFDGDGVCVTPDARSRVHAENARHRGENTRFEVQDPYSYCYLH
jgi:hypothetical protein